MLHKWNVVMITMALLIISLTACNQGGSNKMNMQSNNSYNTNQTNQMNSNKMNSQYPVSHKATVLKQSKKIDDEISMMKGVQIAHVLITEDRNAYVAVILHEAADQPQNMKTNKYHLGVNQIPSVLKRDIIQRVRAIDPTMQHVYVSANPAFIKVMNRIHNQIQQGKPVSDFVKQFNTTVSQVFPKKP